MSLESKLQVSIVVCAHNEEARLRECLKSLLDQQVDPASFEILVINDGSRDQTQSIAVEELMDASLEEAPPRMVVKLAHAGLSRARNVGIRFAKAPLIAFIDGDAIASPHWVRRIQETFASDPDLGVVGGKIEILNPENEVAVFLHVSHFDFYDRLQVIGCNMIFRREVFERVGGFASCFKSRGDETFVVTQAARDFKVEKRSDLIVLHERPESVQGWLRERRANGRFYCWGERIDAGVPRSRIGTGAIKRLMTLTAIPLGILGGILGAPLVIGAALPGALAIVRRTAGQGRAAFVFREARARLSVWSGAKGVLLGVLGDLCSDVGYLEGCLQGPPLDEAMAGESSVVVEQILEESEGGSKCEVSEGLITVP